MLGPNQQNVKPFQRLGLFHQLGSQAFMRPPVRPLGGPPVGTPPPGPVWYVQQAMGRNYAPGRRPPPPYLMEN